MRIYQSYDERMGELRFDPEQSPTFDIKQSQINAI